ncbi:MAG: NADH-quinone oxidoreductase subunit L [Acidobacteria bacterium]|nr:NADH-quinone oxidoreductase subunit L [Acidobacteriota bacterium]
MLKLVWLIPVFPLLGFLINFLLGKKLHLSEKVVSWIACGVIGLSLLITIGAFVEYKTSFNPNNADKPYITSKEPGGFSFTWMPGGRAHLTQGADKGKLANFNIEWSYQIDQLSLVMMFVVTFVGFLIHIFATGYMHGDPGFYRFFSYLNLFMFMMLLLVMGSNFMIMFVGWEGVGLCSYLLIGYYINRQEAGDAAKKAFVVNRIGDLGFALAIFGVFAMFGTLQFHDLAALAKAYPPEALGAFGLMSWIALGLFIGATGKSAQIPLFIWLPDAMAGPTPVSALIHAATMVTAGVFMVTRTNFFFQRSTTMMMVVAVVGCLTAFIAATIGITQTDIKKVLAYSTVSQLGFMFLGAGVGAFVAAIFHVFTHAFFKALLFLGSGSVIHGMHHEQEMPRMGGLKKYLPTTYKTMLMGWLAICGIPLWAGFWSKDEILWNTFDTTRFGGAKILWIVGLFTAGITAFYMTRLMALTFWGEERFRKVHAGGEADEAHAAAYDKDLKPHDAVTASAGDRPHHQPGEHVGAKDASDPFVTHTAAHHHFEPHESPKSMTIPLIVLAAFSLFIGLLGIPHASAFEHWLDPVIEKVHATPQHATTATVEAHGTPQTTASEAHNAAESTASEAQATSQATHEEGEHKPFQMLELILMMASVLVALLGMYLAKVFYLDKPGLAKAWGAKLQPLYKLSFNKWYWDYLLDVKGVAAGKVVNNALWAVDATVVDGGVNGAGALTRLWARLSNLWDKYVIDLLVNATGWISKGGSLVLRTFQTGFWQNYVLVFTLGLFIIVAFYIYPAISATLKGLFGAK